jgi:hypothetical protein
MADDDWQRLLAHLEDLGTVVRAADGRLVLTVGERAVTVLITPREWDETVGVVWGGDVDGALRTVTRAVRSLAAGDRFLVHENYELHPSPTEETPMQREDREALRRVEELRRTNPDAELGWYVERPDGSRTRFPSEPPG